MKLISWNVNGIRAVLKKGFIEFVNKFDPDILCLQETKTPKADVELDLPQYKIYWNHAEKAGYSGTAILSKTEPISVTKGLGIQKHDGEGRVLTAEFKNYYVISVYTPNSKRDLSRLSYRQKEWDIDFLKYIKKLEKKKPVIFCGDLNVAHKEIDLKYPKANIRNHGFTAEEREGFDNIVQAGFIDAFREFESGPDHYTWWSYLGNCRAKNVGWRIDYFCVSAALKSKLKSAKILPDVLGSDHCPVTLQLK